MHLIRCLLLLMCVRHHHPTISSISFLLVNLKICSSTTPHALVSTHIHTLRYVKLCSNMSCHFLSRELNISFSFVLYPKTAVTKCHFYLFLRFFVSSNASFYTCRDIWLFEFFVQLHAYILIHTSTHTHKHTKFSSVICSINFVFLLYVILEMTDNIIVINDNSVYMSCLVFTKQRPLLLYFPFQVRITLPMKYNLPR